MRRGPNAAGEHAVDPRGTDRKAKVGDMKAALLTRYGDNGAVEVGEVSAPAIGDTDILIEVRAASVNPLDVKTRAGQVKLLLKYERPLVMGSFEEAAPLPLVALTAWQASWNWGT